MNVADLLHVEKLSFSYDDTPILEDVTLNVREGEILGIIGPNGSGKTTLLKCITGIQPAQSGKITFKNTPLADMKRMEKARHLAVVPQTNAIDFSFPVSDVVMMGRIPFIGRLGSESPKDAAIAEKAMQETRVIDFAERTVDTLSGGELQRVLIARALAQEPELLLMDEPTAHLDIAHQIETLELVKTLSRKKNIGVILVLHDLNLAAQYADALILLAHGRVVARGSPETVLTPENIKNAYGIHALVREHPLTGVRYVMPFAHHSDARAKRNGLIAAVHVVCGGGSGAALLHALSGRGYKITVGVLNMLDSDYETAENLGLSVVGEAPFSPITDEVHRENLAAIERADAVILAPVLFGTGNLKNLDAVEHAVKKGKTTMLIENDRKNEKINDEKMHDFTGGVAAEKLKKIKAAGAITVKNAEEALTRLEELEKRT